MQVNILHIIIVRKVYQVKGVSWDLLIVISFAQCIVFGFFILSLTTTAPAVSSIVAIEDFIRGSSALVFGCFNIYKLG